LGVQLPAHLSLQRGVDHLVLPHAGQARELGRGDLGLPVVIVPGKVRQRDLGARKGVCEVGEQLAPSAPMSLRGAVRAIRSRRPIVARP